jgi:antitoxin (DNA-binding transcriptional repressor) of toxin-antitoxin stability system
MQITISAEELESRCLEPIDQVEAEGITVVVTKDGHAIVILMPMDGASAPGLTCFSHIPAQFGDNEREQEGENNEHRGDGQKGMLEPCIYPRGRAGLVLSQRCQLK